MLNNKMDLKEVQYYLFLIKVSYNINTHKMEKDDIVRF